MDSQMLFYRARLLLEEGQSQEAQAILQGITPQDEEQQKNCSYLLGWSYIQHKQWDKAIEALSPLLHDCNDISEQASQVERERLTRSILCLGLAAVNLAHYEDAARHFTLCLKILHDRRVQLPKVRIKARYSLAMTCVMRGFYNIAVHHYEEALRLCRHYASQDELPDIYHGLCDAYQHNGNFDRAYETGQEALRLYQQQGNPQMEARMHNLLGRTCFQKNNFRNAADHYTESLAIATGYDSPTMALANCAALAELQLAEQRLEEARRYSQHALALMEHTNDTHMRGHAYLIIGKVAYADSLTLNGEQQSHMQHEAISWFSKARDILQSTQAYPDKAEIYQRLAQAMEDIGYVEEAIDCWRAGYDLLAHRMLPDREKSSNHLHYQH